MATHAFYYYFMGTVTCIVTFILIVVDHWKHFVLAVTLLKISEFLYSYIIPTSQISIHSPSHLFPSFRYPRRASPSGQAVQAVQVRVAGVQHEARVMAGRKESSPSSPHPRHLSRRLPQRVLPLGHCQARPRQHGQYWNLTVSSGNTLIKLTLHQLLSRLIQRTKGLLAVFDDITEHCSLCCLCYVFYEYNHFHSNKQQARVIQSSVVCCI